jgi:hypothetical protein
VDCFTGRPHCAARLRVTNFAQCPFCTILSCLNRFFVLRLFLLPLTKAIFVLNVHVFGL